MFKEIKLMELKNKISFGSVSHGTMRTQDLIPCFVDEILWHDPENEVAERIKSRYEVGMLEDEEDFNPDDYFESEDASYDLNEDLFNELNRLCEDIPYCYFGASEGDGSDYGFWISVDDFDFDGLKVSDLSEVSDDYNGEILEINDHGNMTLYVKNNEEFEEIWSVV
jgi:hypothetical protein